MKTKLTVEIDAPAAVVFKWIVEPECVVQWLNHLSKFDLLEETESGIGVKFNQTWDDEGDNSEISGIISEFVQDERYGLQLDGKGFQVQVEYRLRGVGDTRTRLTQKTEFDYKGIMKMIEEVAGGKIRRSYEDEAKRNLAKLMELCEADT